MFQPNSHSKDAPSNTESGEPRASKEAELAVDVTGADSDEDDNDPAACASPRGTLEGEEDTIIKGYVTMRLGGAGVHVWGVRYLNLSKTKKKPGMFAGKGRDGDIYLTTSESHSEWEAKKKLTITPGKATCMRFERDSYDMGRRKFLWGFRLAHGKDPYVFDSEDGASQARWISTLEECGVRCEGFLLAPKQNPSSLKEGWVIKKGKVMTTWHRRYMILMPNLITYFKWKRDKKPQGYIPLMETTVVEIDTVKSATLIVIPDPSKGARERFGGRNFMITCHDDEVRDQWCAAIKAAIDKLAGRAASAAGSAAPAASASAGPQED